jgi:exosome complex protein LRP1
MDSPLASLIESLDDSIDDLEEVFAPLLKTALVDTVQKLPLLDKAQLYVLITYAIESALFCECYVFWKV